MPRKKAAPGEDRAPHAAAPAPSPAPPQMPPPEPKRHDRAADPGLYDRVFCQGNDGPKVLQDLCARFFDVPTYIKGGVDAQRESDARGARRDVLHYVLQQLKQVADE